VSEGFQGPSPAPPPAGGGPQRRSAEEQVREAVPGSAYGWYDGRPVPATRAALVERLRKGERTPLVWTPETGGRLVPAWTVPYLFDAFRAHGLGRAGRLALGWGAACALLLAFAAATGQLGFGTPLPVFIFLAGVLAAHSALQYRRFRALTPEKLRAEAREVYARPAPRRGPARYTQWLGAALVGVFVAQVLAVLLDGGGPGAALGDASGSFAADRVGVDKGRVRAGEWWRLLSGALVHGNLIHIAFNFMALTALGRVLEAFAHRAFVPLVFLLSALGGGIASVVLMPHGVSVGASGGIMGMFGFLAVTAYRRRRLTPPGFGRALLTDIGIIAAMGVVGYQFIDNAAHAGGFAAGALAGLLAVPTGGDRPHWEPSRAVRLAGDAALGVLFAAAGATAGWLVAAAAGP
jgi:membrane associated rhomboid family serine protease